MYAFRERTGPVELAFTDRLGGVLGAPEPHLAAVAADFAPGARVVDMAQVHGDRVVTVTGAPGPRETCDGLVTDRADVVLVVRVADCVPVLLADLDAGVTAVAHAGRQGLVAGVVPAAVARMRDLGAGRVRAWLGPSICGRCYEVPAAMRAQVADVEPAAAATTSWGTPAVDVAAGVRAQLERDQVEVSDVSRCTLESPDLHSYRRDGERAGRLAGLIRRHP